MFKIHKDMNFKKCFLLLEKDKENIMDGISKQLGSFNLYLCMNCKILNPTELENVYKFNDSFLF